MSIETLEFQLRRGPASAAVACRQGVANAGLKIFETESFAYRVVAVAWGRRGGLMRFEIALSPVTPQETRVVMRGRTWQAHGPVAKRLLRRRLSELRESIEALPVYVRITDYVGSFAGDPDVARELRDSALAPAMHAGEPVIVDFAGVELSTESFIHALVSDLIHSTEFYALGLIDFRHCSQSVRDRLETVVESSQHNAPGRRHDHRT
jgi:hypothetical protein